MKQLILSLATICALGTAHAQITVTGADMPVVGDTLRYTIGDLNRPGANIDLTVKGANQTWNFSNISAYKQDIDTFLLASTVDMSYGAALPTGSYGAKIADTMSFGTTMAHNVYTFFQNRTSPDVLAATGFAAEISSLPMVAPYTDEDEVYQFPLTYTTGTNTASTTYRLYKNAAPLGSIMMKGTRNTVVDAWGKIVTAYFSISVDCIRVRSEVTETDSITYGGNPFVLQRHTVDYRWLTNQSHYPAMWVTANVGTGGQETITAIRYRDVARTGLTNVATTSAPAIHNLKAYPNPSANGIVNLEIPTDWQRYTVEVFDIQSRLVATYNNSNVLNLQQLAQGQYLVRVMSGNEIGYTSITK